MHFVTGSRDDAVARGELSLVDVADSVLVSVCPSLPYVAVDGFPKCLPHFILEGVYARVLVPRVDVLTYEMGVSSLAIEAFTKIEAHLKTLNARQEFSFAVASYSEFIMRLTELPLDGALELAPDEVVSNEILLMPDPDEYWPGDITFEDLTDSVGRLSPFGNLALLLGPRTLTESRTMRPRADGSVSRFASVFVPIQKAARSLDGLDKAPDPPGDGSTVLQEPADKPDVLGAVGNWLKTNCLPYELEVPLVTERIARHQVLLIKQYASDKGESVIRARFDSFIAVFPHLYRVLKGNIVTIQLEFARALAAKLVPDTKLDSVASYHALEAAASKLTYILDAGAGDATFTVRERVAAILAAFDAAQSRANSASSAAASAPVAVSASSSDASGLDLYGCGAKAFDKSRVKELERFLSLHQNALLAKLNTVENDEFDKSPLEAKDASRVLRIAFRAKLVPVWQFLLRPGADSNAELFTTLDTYRISLPRYLAEAVSMSEDGTFAPRAKGFELNDAFVKQIRALDFVGLDLYNETYGKLRNHKDKTQRHRLKWPDEVFGSVEALRHVRDNGDRIFAALGYPRKSKHGFYGKVNRLFVFLDDYAPAGSSPEDSLIECYQNIMLSAQTLARQAMVSGPSFEFPAFGGQHDEWVGKLEKLEAAADNWRGRADLEAAPKSVSYAMDASKTRRAASPSPARSDDARLGGASGYSDDSFARVVRSVSPSRSAMDMPLAAARDAPKSAVKVKVEVGSRARDVFMNASVLRITLPKSVQFGGGTQTFEWKVPDVKKYLKEHEGTDAKCLPCAVVRFADRVKFCTVAGAPGHESATSKCHTFKSQPWIALSKEAYCKRL